MRGQSLSSASARLVARRASGRHGRGVARPSTRLVQPLRPFLNRAMADTEIAGDERPIPAVRFVRQWASARPPDAGVAQDVAASTVLGQTPSEIRISLSDMPEVMVAAA